jgi:hypothetical protein
VSLERRMAFDRARGALLGLALLLAGCGGEGREPEDGGLPLPSGTVTPDGERIMASDPCWRRERSHWHLSLGHCREMLPAKPMTGVWVSGFEVSDFMPAARGIPDPNDPRLYANALEVDAALVERRLGRELKGPASHAIALSFIGRRTKDPVSVDCDGTPYHHIVVDRPLAARYLGIEPSPDPPPPPEVVHAQPSRVRKVHDGVWGALEAEAVERCGGQSEHRASPPGRVSAD